MFKIFLSNSSNPFYEVLPISCFDAFGIGALLAYYKVYGNFLYIKSIKKLLLFLIAALVVWFIYFSRLAFLFSFAISFSSALLVWQAIKGYTGLLGYILNNTFIQYLGKISYGLYVYHNFIPWFLRCITGKEMAYPISIPILKLDWLHGGIIIFLIQFFMLLIISSISWFLIEKPINNLKKYFQ